MRNLRTHGQDIKQRGGLCRNEIQQATAELEALDSQQGQNLNKLRIASPDVAKVWEWVEKNQDKFQKQVYGPPLVECSVKDSRYVDHIESLLQKNDFTVITVQTVADSKTLIDQVTKVMKLRMINIRTMSTSLAQQIARSPPPIPREQLQDFGLDGYALDYINGPEPVLAMLVNAHQLHKAGVALREVDSNKFQVLIDKSLNLFVTGRLHCRTIRRAEYGAAGISTITKIIGPGRHWTEQPVDVSFKRDLQEKLRHWQEEFDAEKVKMETVNTEMEALKAEQRPINEEIVCATFFSSD
jgi:chromosome segregation ATPase